MDVNEEPPDEKFLHSDNKPLRLRSNPKQTKSNQIRKSPGLMGKTLSDGFLPHSLEEMGKRAGKKHLSVFWAV